MTKSGEKSSYTCTRTREGEISNLVKGVRPRRKEKRQKVGLGKIRAGKETRSLVTS